MTAGIILASGYSRRMQRDKLLVDVGGLPLVERVIQTALASRLGDIALVYRTRAVKNIAGRYPGVRCVRNARAAEGQSAAIRLGVRHAPTNVCGYLFLVADQPWLTAAVIDRLLGEFAAHPDRVVVPVYNGHPGNPVIFPVAMRLPLLELRGDRGGRQILRSDPGRVLQVPVPDPAAGFDIDTHDDYVHAAACPTGPARQ
jgi:molybdenum cofactor cytidylyltransferase